MHVLCGVIWNEWGKAVTGGNMEPVGAHGLRVRSAARRVRATRAGVGEPGDRGRPRDRGVVPSSQQAVEDADLIRTKVNLIPESVQEIHVVDIVGLDKQADGGTHVNSTSEIGRFEVVKTESKGKGNKRLRIRVTDA